MYHRRLTFWSLYVNYTRRPNCTNMPNYRFIDIGANITDHMYQGTYNGSNKHPPDLNSVLERSWEAGLEKIIITTGNLEDSRTALQMANTDERLYTTVGCHPTRCDEFTDDPVTYLNQLREQISSSKKVVAIGECGLDYDRLKFCSKDVQKKYFEYQLSLCEEFKLPLFLHCRAAWEDFVEILSRNSSKLNGGVVHSFDGSLENMKEAIRMGFYIGINGCSLKTEENLKVAAEIPSDRLLIETDCPWCEIRPTHASAKYVKTFPQANKKEKFKAGQMVKGRNEPANIRQIVEVLAAIKNEDECSLCEKIFDNTTSLFFK